MSKKRLKVTAPVLKSRAEAEEALGQVRALTIERNTAQCAREKELKALDELFKAEIDGCNTEIEALAEQLRVWAEANPSEFGERRSLELTHGLMGWRTGNPTLKTLAGFTWDRVLERLHEDPRFAGFVRTKEEVDKASILAQRESLAAEDLKAMGVKVVQDEPFFVEPKIEEPAAGRVKEGQ